MFSSWILRYWENIKSSNKRWSTLVSTGQYLMHLYFAIQNHEQKLIAAAGRIPLKAVLKIKTWHRGTMFILRVLHGGTSYKVLSHRKLSLQIVTWERVSESINLEEITWRMIDNNTMTMRSNRPGRLNAGSRTSARLVAPSTITVELLSNPSSSYNNVKQNQNLECYPLSAD